MMHGSGVIICMKCKGFSAKQCSLEKKRKTFYGKKHVGLDLLSPWAKAQTVVRTGEDGWTLRRRGGPCGQQTTSRTQGGVAESTNGEDAPASAPGHGTAR